jgi:hypothetical protein
MRNTSKRTRRISFAVLGFILAFFAVEGSSCESGSDSQNAENNQQEAASGQFVKNQPIPNLNYSQLRQNLIEVEKAQAAGVQTTTFFFNQGGLDPLFICPSVGVPIPNTSSLSNPQRSEMHTGDSGGGNVVIGQMDPNGVYTPESSSGTYVFCIDATGAPVATYWEGFVFSVFAPAKSGVAHGGADRASLGEVQ